MPESELTGVDQLLLGHLPALVCLNLRLERAYLCGLLARCCDECMRWRSAYRFRRLGLDDELVLLEILGSCE